MSVFYLALLIRSFTICLKRTKHKIISRRSDSKVLLMRSADDQAHKGTCVGCACGAGVDNEGGTILSCLHLVRFQQAWSEVGLEGGWAVSMDGTSVMKKKGAGQWDTPRGWFGWSSESAFSVS